MYKVSSTDQPKHPHYSVEAVRLSSFSKWSTTSLQDPFILCDAGFFYTGYSDCVRCYCCGGGLRSWDGEDDPWIEHARWYPHCEYLRRRKGEEFINRYRQDNNDSPKVPLAEPPRTSQEEKIKKEIEGSISQSSCDEEEEDDIATRSVLEMGYSKAVTDSAVQQLRKQGKINYTAADIMQIILAKEEDASNVADSVSATPSIPKHSTTSTDAASLRLENLHLKDQMTCKICLDQQSCMVYLPCGHMVTCSSCAPTIRKCCMCRQLIQGYVRAYL